MQQQVGAAQLQDTGRTLFIVGALGSAAFFVAQVVQAFVLAKLPDAASDPATLHRFAVSFGNLLRKGLVFAAIAALTITYVAVFVRVAARATDRTGFGSRFGCAIVGLACAVGFVGFELLIRSIDLFVVTEWRLQWLAGDADSRTRIGAWIQAFSGITAALYLPLLLSYAGASFCFAATLAPVTRLDRAMQIAFAVHGAQIVLRIALMHFDQAWLEPIVRIAYLPVVLVHALTLALWLVNESRRGR